MKEKVAVVIPYYHSCLSEKERVSFVQCIKILHSYPIILIVPDTIKEEEYPKESKLLFMKVPSKWLESVSAYNQMMLNCDFYKCFLNYKYILVYQLDAFVFRDELERFCDLDYDYIGAVWPLGVRYIKNERNCIWYVGNGGLSLRNVEASLAMLNNNPADSWKLQEDVYWATCSSEGYKVAPKEIAVQFSIEMYVRRMFAFNGNRLPFGCHAWEKMDFPFWRPFFEKEGYVFPEEMKGELDREHETVRPDILSIPDQIVAKGLMKLTSYPKNQIYVWGAGKIGREFILFLRHTNISLRCIDSDEDKWGKCLWDVRIESPKIVKEKKGNVLLIIAVGELYRNEIMSFLAENEFVEAQEIYYYQDIQNKILELYENTFI